MWYSSNKSLDGALRKDKHLNFVIPNRLPARVMNHALETLGQGQLGKIRVSRDVIVRPLLEADAPKILAVALEAWQHTYHKLFDQQFIENFVNRNYSEAAIASLFPRIQSGSMFFDVVEHQSRIIGFCNLGIDNQSAELYRIYLLPTFIGQGIGQKMLELGEAFVREHRLNSYFCFVHKGNEIGKRFYLKSGFRHILEKDKEDEWFMEKTI
jgi:ribosomal protein S18 acetylase RimI-like enzyme